jgi:hypothetical protein
LHDALLEIETRLGFNGGEIQPFKGWETDPDFSREALELLPPGDIATLTGFFHPDSFRNVLLRQARHFKDPSIQSTHGEYTHRIQWWIICQEQLTKGQYAVENPPLKCFQAMALKKCRTRHWATKDPNNIKTMWDLIVDCFEPNSNEAADGPTSDSYRTPNRLNKDFCLVPNDRPYLQQSERFDLLSQFLTFRYMKRSSQMGTLGNATREKLTDLLAKKVEPDIAQQMRPDWIDEAGNIPRDELEWFARSVEEKAKEEAAKMVEKAAGKGGLGYGSAISRKAVEPSNK